MGTFICYLHDKENIMARTKNAVPVSQDTKDTSTAVSESQLPRETKNADVSIPETQKPEVAKNDTSAVSESQNVRVRFLKTYADVSGVCKEGEIRDISTSLFDRLQAVGAVKECT